MIANFFAWQEVFRINNRTLKVVFFDVGQGDSIFIETSRGNLILIDGGPDSIVLEKIAGEIPFYRRKIDLVVLTHPHTDHFIGLSYVLRSYNVENILLTGVVSKGSRYQEFLKLAEKSKANIYNTKGDQMIKLPSKKREKYLKILFPFEDISGTKTSDLNSTSVVAKLVSGDVSFLFTGDICENIEKRMIENKKNIKSNVLKVAHHGSRYSSSEDFLKKSFPEIAVIQAGKNNSYGHPHPEVLSRLEEFGIKTLITKNDGDVVIISDGDNLLIKE